MRTTIDIPDELLRKAKIRAAERGIKLKDLFTASLIKELEPDPTVPKQGRTQPIPVSIKGVDWTFPNRTNADLMHAIEQDEV
jgi:hypothetical protein